MMGSTPHPSPAYLESYLNLWLASELGGWGRLTKWQRLVVRDTESAHLSVLS